MILEATIDPITRSINFAEDPISGETDVDVTGIRFTCPNDIGIETDLYNMNIKVRYANARKELSTFYVISKSLQDNNVVFTWTMNEPAGRYDGVLYFNVTAEYFSGQTLTKRWNTRMYPIEIFKTLDEGNEQPTVEQLTEFEILLNQLSDAVEDMTDLKEAMETAAAASSELTATGDGTVTLSGISDPTAVGEWYEDYVEGAHWLVGKSAIPANADLDSYTTIGNYYAPTASVSATLSNTPITDEPFGLMIEKPIPSETYLHQLATGTASKSTFLRTSSDGGSTWSIWTEHTTQTKRNVADDTVFTFNIKRGINSIGEASHNHFLLIGGGSTGNQSMWLGFMPAENDTVTIKEVTSVAHYTLTATYANSVMTITSDKLVYGGLRMIWLS